MAAKSHFIKSSAHSSQTAYLSPKAPSNPLWQTDVRGIWKLSYSQTAMSSYPSLATQSMNQGIKTNINSTSRESCKDYFAWWDKLVTTGVCLCGSEVCNFSDIVGSKPEQVQWLAPWLLVTHPAVQHGLMSLIWEVYSTEEKHLSCYGIKMIDMKETYRYQSRNLNKTHF